MKTQLNKRISQFCEKNKVQFYWDYREQLSKKNINLILDGGLMDFEDELWNLNIDYIFDLENDFINNVLIPEFEEGLKASGINDMYDYLRDFIIIDMNIQELIKHTSDILCFVPFYSNYDCTNSFDTLETSDYLKQVYKRVKKGVNKDDFMWEHTNGAYGGCLFGFIFSANLMDILELKKQIKEGKKVFIPKGTQYGFFSSFQGAGSCFEKVTVNDMFVNIKETGKNYNPEFDCINIIADCELSYSFTDVYGCSSDFADNQNILVK